MGESFRKAEKIEVSTLVTIKVRIYAARFGCAGAFGRAAKACVVSPECDDHKTVAAVG